MNSWLKILLAYKNGNFSRYYHGLTPTLIVGACQSPIGEGFETAQEAYKESKRIFEEMRLFNKNGFIVTSSRCNIYNGPVMLLKEASWTEEAFDTTFEAIWECYGSDIESGNFRITKYDKKVLNEIFP